MKRTREDRLTREQIENGDYGDEGDNVQVNQIPSSLASEAILGSRKIVRVKRHIQETGEVKTEVPSKPAQFKLVGSLSSAPAPASKPTNFNFSASATATAVNGTDQPKKEQEAAKTASESKNLFGGGGPVKFSVATGGTFGGVKVGDNKATGGLFAAKPAAAATGTANEPIFKPISGGSFGGVKLPEQKPEQKAPAATSIFGGVKPATGGSLFGNLNTVKSQESDPAKKTSLFGGNPTASTDGNQKFGLFFGKQASDGGATDNSKPEEKKTSLFGGGNPTGGSLFGNAPATGGNGLFGSVPASGSLFGKPTSGTSLFGGANQGPSLFNFSAAPKKAEDENSDEEEEGEKSPPIYADTTKVEFKGAGAQTIQPSPYTKLFEKHVGTFKIVKPDDQVRKITNCELSLEFAEVNSKKVYLVVVRQAKKMLLQGTLSGKVSRSRRVEEKSAKNQLKVCVQLTVDVQVEKEGGEKVKQKKIIFPYCAINFSRQEEMVNFETEFTKAVSELKGQAQPV